MIQIASETVLKYATALFSEVFGLGLSILYEVSGKIAASNTGTQKGMLNNRRLYSAIGGF